MNHAKRGSIYEAIWPPLLLLSVSVAGISSSIAVAPEPQENSGGEFYQIVLPVGFELDRSKAEQQTYLFLLHIDTNGTVVDAEFRGEPKEEQAKNVALLQNSILKWRATPPVANGRALPKLGMYLDFLIGDRRNGEDDSIRVFDGSAVVFEGVLPGPTLKESEGTDESKEISTGVVDKPIATFPHEGKSEVSCSDFDSRPIVLNDGRSLLTWQWDTATIRQVDGGKIVASFRHDGRILGCRLFGDEEYLLIWDDNGIAKVWPVRGGVAISEFPHEGIRCGPEVIRDGEQLLTWKEGVAKVWPIGGGRPITTTGSPVNGLKFDAKLIMEGKRLLTWDEDGLAKIWPIGSGLPTATFPHLTGTGGPKVIGGGRQLLTWTLEEIPDVPVGNGLILIWPIEGGNPISSIPLKGNLVADASVVGDGNQLLAWSILGPGSVWQIAGGKAVTTFSIEGGFTDVQLIAEGKQLLGCGGDGAIRIWPIDGGDPVVSFQLERGVNGSRIINGARIINGGQRLLAWGQDGTARIWSIAGGTPIATFQHGDSINGAMLLDDEALLVTWGGDGMAKLWKIEG